MARITIEEHRKDESAQIDEILTALEDETTNGNAAWSLGLRAAYQGGALKGGDLEPFTRRNQMVLTLLGMARGYKSRTWFTPNHARAQGFPIDFPGALAQHATAFLPIYKQREGAPKGDNRFSGFRAYRVYNGDLCPGWTDPTPEAVAPHPAPEVAERALVGMWRGVTFGGSRAFYRPSSDSVTMPPRDAFKSLGRFLATLLHERIHQTGHEDRQKREGIVNPAIFGDHRYAQEEIVAESGAAVALALLGLEVETPHHGAYLRSWLRESGNTPDALARGMAQGVEAARYLLKSAGLAQ